ncbi:DNA gyrase inhibitor YacG [Marinicauda algicola]|uniref:DNA gyrase inhibitor YacG n=1 Tax=Marinicauda algicola TaxID=2029849 RepID=A0A4S2H3C6_9PROT|nr:DNA gyrase inhibitor YacG [Marinicauda algicola]TGY89752.1 DNA gyrase inhibitor YacG [Marinicauda algicola]
MTETTKTTAPKCPSCNAPAVREFRPFCSKRCADADLGRWFSGAYAIPGQPVPREALPPREGEDDETGR